MVKAPAMRMFCRSGLIRLTADRAGTPLHRLTDDAAQDIVPRWSPDGHWIAFLSDRSGKYEIWKVRPDGSGLSQMTHEPEREVIAPVWSPDGCKLLCSIVFQGSGASSSR